MEQLLGDLRDPLDGHAGPLLHGEGAAAIAIGSDAPLAGLAPA
jgi:hypothetical protein